MQKYTVLVGSKFNYLTVVKEPWWVKEKSQSFIRCKCDCGVEKDYFLRSILKGHTKSCGCKKSELTSKGLQKTPLPKIGDKFCYLTVIGNPFKRGRIKFIPCQCDCGEKVDLRVEQWQKQLIKSCNCKRSELLKNNIPPNLRHGQSNTRLHGIWDKMKQRCYNPNNKGYQYYGQKGIKVCNDWLIFENFYNWSQANGYTINLTIDRIDADKDYCPENCRWVSLSENVRNKNISEATKKRLLIQQNKEILKENEILKNQNDLYKAIINVIKKQQLV